MRIETVVDCPAVPAVKAGWPGRSVFARSPAFTGIRDGATPMQSCPIDTLAVAAAAAGTRFMAVAQPRAARCRSLASLHT